MRSISAGPNFGNICSRRVSIVPSASAALSSLFAASDALETDVRSGANACSVGTRSVIGTLLCLGLGGRGLLLPRNRQIFDPPGTTLQARRLRVKRHQPENFIRHVGVDPKAESF